MTLKLPQESQDRVRSMALVHELLYGSENLAAVDFSKYASDPCEQLIETYGHPAGLVRLTRDLEAFRLNIDQAVPCGLVLNEIVSNGIKHAFPGGRAGTNHLTLRRRSERIAPDERGRRRRRYLRRHGSRGARLASA
ncbi:MAG TPA: histidine kinase dimerization/phosphoacceptor domain -containing protein [Thermoanaerobaculia bacterium]|nr:histidine kinase dimerization/phosphoacceptor domain -containing protein [Thermoanaerobaculia bacterium]